MEMIWIKWCMWNEMICFAICFEYILCYVKKICRRCFWRRRQHHYRLAASSCCICDSNVFSAFNFRLPFGLIIDNIIHHQMNKMSPCLCATYSIRLHGAECANLYHGSSVWPSELKWTNNNNNADEDDDDDKNCEDYKQTNKHTNKRTHENMTHIHLRMDNKIFLFAPDIFKWSLFFLSHAVFTSDELSCPTDSTQQMILFVYHQI